MTLTAGEIYFIGERDLRSGEKTPYFKVGIVRENQENESRDSAERLLEHQTGNPRELYIEHVVRTELVEKVETLLHKKFAPFGVRGEWMMLNEIDLEKVKVAAIELSIEAQVMVKDLGTVEELSNTISDELILDSTEELLKYSQTYLESSLIIKECDRLVLEIKRVFSTTNENNEVEDVSKFVEIQERKGREIFQEIEFKIKNPELYASFLRTTTKIGGTPSFTGSRGFTANIEELDPLLYSLIQRFEPLIVNITQGLASKESLHGINLDLLPIKSAAEWEKTKAENRIKIACGSHAGIDSILKWPRVNKTSKILDKTALKVAHPEIVAEFTIRAESTKAVVIDPKKGY